MAGEARCFLEDQRVACLRALLRWGWNCLRAQQAAQQELPGDTGASEELTTEEPTTPWYFLAGSSGHHVDLEASWRNEAREARSRQAALRSQLQTAEETVRELRQRCGGLEEEAGLLRAAAREAEALREAGQANQDRKLWEEEAKWQCEALRAMARLGIAPPV